MGHWDTIGFGMPYFIIVLVVIIFTRDRLSKMPNSAGAFFKSNKGGLLALFLLIALWFLPFSDVFFP